MPTRRTFLKQNSMLAVGAWAVGSASFSITEGCSESTAPVAETTYGKLRGRTEERIHVFRGIPYGADTTGKNRFMPPQKPVSWQGVRDANGLGALRAAAIAGQQLLLHPCRPVGHISQVERARIALC